MLSPSSPFFFQNILMELDKYRLWRLNQVLNEVIITTEKEFIIVTKIMPSIMTVSAPARPPTNICPGTCSPAHLKNSLLIFVALVPAPGNFGQNSCVMCRCVCQHYPLQCPTEITDNLQSVACIFPNPAIFH